MNSQNSQTRVKQKPPKQTVKSRDSNTIQGIIAQHPINTFMINQDQRSQNNNTALDENNFSFDARVDKVDISIP